MGCTRHALRLPDGPQKARQNTKKNDNFQFHVALGHTYELILDQISKNGIPRLHHHLCACAQTCVALDSLFKQNRPHTERLTGVLKAVLFCPRANGAQIEVMGHKWCTNRSAGAQMVHKYISMPTKAMLKEMFSIVLIPKEGLQHNCYCKRAQLLTVWAKPCKHARIYISLKHVSNDYDRCATIAIVVQIWLIENLQQYEYILKPCWGECTKHKHTVLVAIVVAR